MEIKILPFCVKRKEPNRMNAAVEARPLLLRLMGPVEPGTPLKALYPRAARLLGVTVRRIETLWRGTAVPKADEMDRLRALVAAKSFEDTHADILDRHAARLEAVDPDFYGPEISRLRRQAHQLRNLAD